MSNMVVIVVDLDAAVAPPAADSVRQLLALIDGLPSEGGDIDGRLVSVSVNSPLRAELRAFTKSGDEVSEARVVAAAQSAFGVLDSVNDNDSEVDLRRIDDEERRRLRSLLTPMRNHGGRVSVSVPGRLEQTITAERAERVLAAINRAPRKRAPEVGSVEGQILSAATHYGSPALRIRRFLSEEEVLCVFERGSTREIGRHHTLDEVWAGQRVLVQGRVSFDANGRATVVHATDMRTFGPTVEAQTLIAEAQARGERAGDDLWGDDA